jgi:hypothetical protein
VSSVSFWHEADIEEARIGATPNVRFAAASLNGRLAAEGREPPPVGGGAATATRSKLRRSRSSRVAYCLSNIVTFSVFSPFSLVILRVDVSVLPSLETVRRVVPTAFPAIFNVNSAVLLSTCFPERLS